MFVPTEKNKRHNRHSHELETLAKICLKDGPASATVARDLTIKLRDGAARREIYATDYTGLLRSVFISQPEAVLSTLFPADEAARKSGIAFFEHIGRHEKHPLDGVPDTAILDWCDGAPAVRYPTMAKVAPLFAGDGDATGLQLTSLMRVLLIRSPSIAEVLQTIISRVHTPHSWSGSLAKRARDEAEIAPDARHRIAA